MAHRVDMDESWQNLKPGDRIRLVAMPSEFSRPGYHLSRETRRVYQRLIARRRPLRIAAIDDAGRPWIRVRFRRPDGLWEHHALAVNHDGWVRVGARSGTRGSGDAVTVKLEKPTRRR